MRLFVAVYPPAPAVADLAGFVSSLHVGRAAAAGVNTRLAKPATYHLTLAFLGEVPDERLADVEVAIGQAVDRFQARAATVARRAARAAAREGADPASNADAMDPGLASRPGPRKTQGAADAARRAGGNGPPSEVDVARKQPWPDVPELALSGGGRFGRGAFTLMWVGVSGDLEPIRALHKALRRELKHARFPYDQRPWKPHLTVARPGDRIPKADLDADREALNAYIGPTWPAHELFLMRSNLGPEPTYERLTNWLF